MPCVEIKISGIELTEEFHTLVESSLTSALQEEISHVFPIELGFTEGSKEFEVCRQIAHNIMPGWTWITLEEARWAVRGRVDSDAVTARVHVLLLANAVYTPYRQEVAQKVKEVILPILKSSGKPVHLFVDVIEGEVDMTLPKDLFEPYLRDASDKLLTPGGVVQFIMAETMKALENERV
ncbi:hypothetical protein [Paenibacillus agilis]|uniref:Uncharacterized protein n=1 Tax=Paenibacillus agilis TaxID=3020863 RepID=A0A559J118_9BACL|nr:hypothetical protein [Paenibacillus agilis]TVX93585.1 hypothetical protein FPZ44_11270 [Paenibacillus agilis]